MPARRVQAGSGLSTGSAIQRVDVAEATVDTWYDQSLKHAAVG